MDQELKTPDFIENRIDLKAATISCLQNAIDTMKTPDLEINLHPDTKVILLTNIGMIEGDIAFQKPEKTPASVAIFDASIKVRNDMIAKEANSDTVIVNNVGIITVCNAKITPWSNPNAVSNMGIVNLFTDQILGFTFGNK